MLFTGTKLKDFYDYANDFNDRSVVFDRDFTDQFCWHNGRKWYNRLWQKEVSWDYGKKYVLLFCGELYKVHYNKEADKFSCEFWLDLNLNANQLNEIKDWGPICFFEFPESKFKRCFVEKLPTEFKVSWLEEGGCTPPSLRELNFQNNKSAEDVVACLYDYIVKDKSIQITNSPTDMNRFEKKGFDTKNSFRPKKKN